MILYLFSLAGWYITKDDDENLENSSQNDFVWVQQDKHKLRY